ncbi:MAG: lipid-binding SYLF domain-containing protein [Candidatus Omnitrophota bacterium]|jgi:lipid-binding SYLF domain-containing protein
MSEFRIVQKITGFLGLLTISVFFVGGLASTALADTAVSIDSNVDETLERFYKEVGSGKKLIQDAKGVLIFPSVVQGGFGVGGSFGEGSLRINGKTVDYYNTAMLSVGFQIGLQKKSMIFLCMQDEVLNRLRNSSNWKVGADAAVTLVNVGADGSIDTQKTNEPIIAFVIGQKGLMYNLTLEGTKFTKIIK